MLRQRKIWVLPEVNGPAEEIGKLSCGLLAEARDVADKVGGIVAALVLTSQVKYDTDVFRRYGVDRAYVFCDPALGCFSAEAYLAVLLKTVKKESPWLFLMGDTIVGRELGPRLAFLLETGCVSGCVGMDLSDPARPVFSRSVYGGQLYQEVVFQVAKTMLVTMDPRALNAIPGSRSEEVAISVIRPGLSGKDMRVKHLEFLPEDFRTVDVTEADVIVAAGMGAVTSNMLPLAEELAILVEGSIGTTRPVVDEGKIAKERMIGQTGKVVNPGFYLDLGVSGATHHLGGIQDSGMIVSVNRDPHAPVFQSSDIGVVAELEDVLPKLVEKIKQAKKDGKIL